MNLQIKVDEKVLVLRILIIAKVMKYFLGLKTITNFISFVYWKNRKKLSNAKLKVFIYHTVKLIATIFFLIILILCRYILIN